MAKYCSNCGKEISKEDSFCKNCGKKLNEEKETKKIDPNRPKIQNTDIAVAIILSIVTCGIYGIYWYYKIVCDVNTVTGDNTTSGGTVVLLTIITCGIYGIYWSYKTGQKLYETGERYGINISDNSIIYLVLALCGFQIINYCIIQGDLNKFSA